MRLILLFVFVPFLELFLLLKLADIITGFWTFVLVVVTGVIGANLARRQGWSVITRLQSEVGRGELPTTTLVDALMIFVAGALLITPGILTDLFGFSLLVPFCRRFYRGAIVNWLRTHTTVTTYTSTQGGGFRQPESEQVIDSYVVSRPDEEPDEPSSPSS